jgi:nucleoid-associated protein YgaU
MNNLLSQADALKADAQKFELDALLPDDYKAVDSSYAAVAAEYQAVIAGGFDGTKAFPIKAKLEASVTDWESFNAKGMPLKADSEFENASNMRAKAMEADASTLAADRYAKAEENLSQANASVGGKDFAAAIPAYKYSAAAYEVAAEKAKANTLREKIFENGYAKYSDSFFKMGEDQYAVEDSSWAKGSLEDLAAGIAALKNANGNYEFVISKGAEYKSFEGKDAALAAQQKALSVKADINASEEYSGASDILTEALANQGNGSYESAYLWFGDASSAFGSAYDSTMNIKAAADDAIGVAEESVQKSDATAVEADLGDNVYIKEAKDRLDQAKAQYGDQLFSDATSNANEALNYSTMSDNFVVSEKARLDKEAADKLSADKAAADPAMTDARNRLAWASANDIGKDYPNQYKDAKTGMAAAELAYANERYAPAKALAGDVSATISDSFQSQVLAERQAIADKAAADKATADKAAADKAAADKAAADAAAQAAAAQAAADKAAAEAAAAQAAAEKAAAEQAAAEQAAAAQLATEKAAADPAMADARDRMAWADSDNIAAEYPSQYKDASANLNAAELAYGNSQYVSAKSLAESSSAILSDEFKTQVVSDRKAAAEKAAADKAAAEAAAAAQAAADKAAADAAAAKAAADQIAVEQAAATRAAADKAAAEEAARQAAITQAKSDIDKAQAKLDWAVSKNAKNNYSSLWAQGAGQLDAAKFAFDLKDYKTASAKAQASYVTLSGIAEFAPLPAKYTVRLIPERRDCLWRIAEYGFVYNNPLKWPILYEANKKTFKDPSNPNLIYPGQVLVIPSIKGETREGSWDPNKTYQPLAK